MRAFRPSHFATADDLDEDGERVKLENLSLYETLAKMGKPLFDLADIAKHGEVRHEAASRQH